MQGNKHTILYVESDLAMFASAAKMLSRNGFILHVAENGREGLRLFSELKPNVVISELNLPGMSGIEMVRQIRQLSPTTPIILLSASFDSERLIELINLGITSFIRKPVVEAELSSAIEKCLTGQLLSGEGVTEGHVDSDVVIGINGENHDAEEDIRKINAELEYRLLRRNALLEAAHKELEDFCDAISHDLRGPLARLQGFSQVLLEDYGSKLDPQGQVYLEKIDQTSRQLKRILDALLDLSQLTRKSVAAQEVDLSSIAYAIARQLKNTMPRRKVTFVVTPGVIVKGDASLLRIALENLLGNAWKFTARNEHARIEFGVAGTNGKSVFFVRDNGVGFEISQLNKLFKPFHRIHEEKEFAGSGVGLAAVHRIVKRHGGRIWAEAEEGKGATFYFTLQ
jgi:signal transduction histidine kinase